MNVERESQDVDQILSVSIPKAVMSAHAPVASQETRRTDACKSLACVLMAQSAIEMLSVNMRVGIALGVRINSLVLHFKLLIFPLDSQMQMQSRMGWRWFVLRHR